MGLRTRGFEDASQSSKTWKSPSRLILPALALLTFLIVHSSVRVFAIDGPSMQPGLHSGEYVAVDQLAYTVAAPRRGDVVLLHPPGTPGVTFIKRIIGVPGDVITLTATTVYVNGHALREPYTFPRAPGEVENDVVIPHLTLQPGQYFVLGDHRQESEDSRIFGPVPRQDIIGKVLWLVWPLGAARSLAA